METTTFQLNECLKEGIIQGVLWNADTVRRTAACLARTPHLPQLAILDKNKFDTAATFGALLQLLAPRMELTRLYIAQTDLSSLLVELAAVFGTTTTSHLQELELVTGGKIRDEDAVHLRRLVQIPSTSLSITFSLKQKDYQSCLQALREGREEAQRGTNTTAARVMFRNVSFPDHEFYLHRFLAMVCQAKCVDCLQLNPRRRRAADACESMKVGPGFLQAIARALAFDSRIKSLEVTNCVVDPHMIMIDDDDGIVAELRQALAHNTTLQRLSLPFTKGLARVWQHALFPALTMNRTLKRLEFGHEAGIVHAFLQHLPQMRGLESVQAPWRTQDGPAWMAAVQRTQSLCQVNFRLVPDLTTTKQGCPEEDYCLSQTRQWVERNRMTRAALVLVARESAVGPLVEQLAHSCFQQEAGLDARYVVLRESLALFSSSC